MQREITVADVVERMGGHGTAHLRQIEELKAAATKTAATSSFSQP
jgi:hypothetical protein